MPQRIDLGGGLQVAVEDGESVEGRDLEDLGLLASEIEESLPVLLRKRVLGFIVGGVKVALRIARDKT